MDFFKRTFLCMCVCFSVTHYALSAPCPDVVTIKSTQLNRVKKLSDAFYIYGETTYLGQTWYVATGLYRSEEESREVSPRVVEKAEDPEIGFEGDEVYCAYYVNFLMSKMLIATNYDWTSRWQSSPLQQIQFRNLKKHTTKH